MNENLVDTKLHCYHCGEECPDDTIYIEDKNFCCNGCKTVYEILSENDMCEYYQLSDTPGINQKKNEFGDKFAFLENEEIARELLSFSSETLQKVTLHVPTMHCSSCIWLLENLYKMTKGISYSRVNFMRREMTLSFNPQEITFRQVAELLTRLGYEPKINLQDLQKQSKKSESKALLYKIGIIGFAFGNIMLLSFPDYLALEDWVDTEQKAFFGYLNILLSLPVFFYGASDYFKSAFKAIRAKAINIDVPIVLGVVALFTRSLYEIISMTGAGYLDSLAGLVFFLLVGKLVQEKTYQSLSFERDYKSYFPLAVMVRNRENENETIAKTVTSLKKGDEMFIRNKELIPADSILISEEAYIDYSFVTGEAEPIAKKQGDYIYAGGRQVGHTIHLAVQKEVAQSYLTQLWNSETFKKDVESAMERRISIFSKYFTYGTLGIATLALLFWAWTDASVMWNAFTAVLIVACPCALALATPYALGNTMRIFGRNKLYVKNSEVIEQMATVNHLVFDKTGTITQNEATEVQFKAKEGALTEEEKILLKSLIIHSTHPLSRKISLYFKDIEAKPLADFEELEGKGLKGILEGNEILLGSKSFLNVAKDEREKQINSEVHLKINGKYKGYFLIGNQYRKGLESLMRNLRRVYETSLISGDNDAERENLLPFFTEKSQMKFEQKPQDKLSFIQNLQNENQKVLMLGDGLNDAGALSKSHIGIALTEDTTSFSPACDAILDAKAFDKIDAFLKFSKTSVKIVKWSFALSLFYNLIGITFAVTGMLSPVFAAILMPTSSISVVGFVVLATNLLAKRKGLL